MRLPFATWMELDGIMSGHINNIEIVHHFNDTDFPQELDAWVDFFGDGDKINIGERAFIYHSSYSRIKEEMPELN